MSFATNQRALWIGVVAAIGAIAAEAGEPLVPLKVGHIRIRDPYIYADHHRKTYCMYAQTANRRDSGYLGVEAYTSTDLVHWANPRPVLTLPDDAGIQSVWAPEMHNYNGEYYLFVTLTFHETLPISKPVEDAKWPAMHKRGTHIFHSDNPLGPFKRLKKSSHTPEEWMALDGTLYVEDGTPYMIFCHEWVQVIDGTMDYVELKKDLSDTNDQPRFMFKASSAPGTIESPKAGNVTDGCFVYRSPKTGRLFMIWSTFVPGSGYCVVLTHSESGRIAGPWQRQELIYARDGGHGMIFESFDGTLIMAIHGPNRGPEERLHLLEIVDTGETLRVEREIELR